MPRRSKPKAAANAAIAYVRVSTEEQARDGVSLDAQEERVRAYCHAAGLELVAVIREEGVSASKPLADRPKGSDLVRRLQRGDATHVVALKLDRLFRDAVDALNQSRGWERRGIALHLIDLGGQALNTGTAIGKMFFTMTAAFAELERNLIGERTSAAMAHKKSRREVYSPTPYGWDRDGDSLKRNATEQRVIERMRRMRGDGLSYQAIAATLNTRGVRAKRGGRWHASQVHYVLNNSLHASTA